MDAFKIKVALKDSDPEVTRTLLIHSDASFTDLNNAVLASMRWYDFEDHYIDAADQMIGPVYDESEGDLIDEECEPIASHEGEAMEYICGCWALSIKWLDREQGYDMPWSVLVDGSGDAPPEDCEGLEEYYSLIADTDNSENENYEMAAAVDETSFDPDTINTNLQAWPVQGIRTEDSEPLSGFTRMVIMAALGSMIDKPLVFDLDDMKPRVVKRVRCSKPRNRIDIDLPSVSPEEIEVNPDRYLPLADRGSVRGKAIAKAFAEKHPGISWPDFDAENPEAFGSKVMENNLDAEFSEHVIEMYTRELMDWAKKNGFYFKEDMDDLTSLLDGMEF